MTTLHVDAGSLETLPRPCPNCGKVLTASLGISVGDKSPKRQIKAGDISVCAYCGVPMVATEVGFRSMPQSEFDGLDPDVKVVLKTAMDSFNDGGVQ